MKVEVKEKTGYWRVILLLLLGVNYTIVATSHTLHTFQGYTPDYFCQVDNVNASVEGCVKELNTSTQTNEPSCPQGYQFESERGDWTIVTEWQLVCENRALRPLTATLYFCGVTLGSIICGMLADRYGRRPLVLICLYIQGLLGVSLYFCSSLEVFMGIRFVQGFFIQGLQGVTFTLVVELLPTRLRTAVTVVLGQFWFLGLVYLASASYYVPNWRTLQLVLSIPTVVTLLYIYLIPESARWLATRGRHREAQKVWDRILPHKKNKFSREMELIRKNLISNEIKCTASSAKSNKQNIKTKKSAAKNGLPCNKNTSKIGKYAAEENKLLTVDCIESRKGIGKKEHKNYISPEETTLKRNSGGEGSISHDEITGVGYVPKNTLQKMCGIDICDKTNSISNNSQSCTRDSFEMSTCINNGSENSNRADSQNDRKVQIGNLFIEPLLISDESSFENQRNKRLVERNTLCESISVNITNKCEGEKSNKTKKVISTNGSNLAVQSVKVSDDNNEVTSRSTSYKDSLFDKNNELETADIPNSEKTKTRRGILQLFRRGVLRKYNLIMIFVWFSVAFSYYGITFHVPDLSGERHLNFILGAILESVAYFIAYFILLRFGRRRPMVCFLLISGFICVVVGAASMVSKKNAGWIEYTQTALTLLGKGTVVSAFFTTYLYTSELFPTILRAAAVGHCGFWGRVGSLLAPQILFLGEYTMPAVPLLMMGVLSMLAGLLVLALPETLGQQIPDTVEEAELLAKNRRQI